MIPGLWCQESGLLLVHTLSLAARTFLSIYVASLEGHIVKHIVRRDAQSFMFMLLRYVANSKFPHIYGVVKNILFFRSELVLLVFAL